MTNDPQMLFRISFVFLCLVLGFPSGSIGGEKPPNVILIMTDDQGYGDLSVHGNPILKTPHMDQLHSESIRFTNFHVDPTCSPTRSALLTGRYSTRTGVWHTINGRSLMRTEEVTMAEVFQANGYRTAMFGKWHLGSNYPSRPMDQGFDRSIMHLDGAIGGGPDYWGNDYFDDHYLVDGEWRPFKGYCTDVWFDETAKFIEANRDHPFFVYLSPNAPHWPYIVEDRYAEPFRKTGMPEDLANFYGMIVNIDENLGKLRKRLKELNLSEDTLLLFMTDNGTTAGWICLDSGYQYYNSGMRGWKGSEWEGGHRVPLFMHWPQGGLKTGKDVEALTAHIDILPTLVDLLDLKMPKGPKVDGISMKSLMGGSDSRVFAERTLFAHVQRTDTPPKWEKSVAMHGSWRLCNGEALYDLSKDPGQKTNVSKDHPEMVRKLRAAYESWWADLEPSTRQTVHLGLGGLENPVTLYSHDWLMPGEKRAVWHQNQIRRGELTNGPWAVSVETAGLYEIKLFRWAPYLNKVMDMSSARLSVGGFDEAIALQATDTCASFEVNLPIGPAMLQGWLTRPSGEVSGAYYVTVELKR
jgi:arylsulfatase A-like enzyme